MTIRDGKPDGYTTLTPFLVCQPAAAAIEFYTAVFGASLVSRMDGPGDTVMHGELALGDGRLQLSDPMDEYGLVPPSGAAADRVSSSTCIYVSDVDAVFELAVEHGATVREKPSTFVTGDRSLHLRLAFDTAGIRAGRQPEEAERRLANGRRAASHSPAALRPEAWCGSGKPSP
jgi:PhnB protein